MESVGKKRISFGENMNALEKNFDICRKLSKLSYETAPPGMVDNWVAINLLGGGSVSSGVNRIPGYANLNFSCIAYKNIHSKEIIIAFRGTDDKVDIITDLNFVFKTLPSITPKFAKEAYEIIKRNPEFQDCKIWLTGHSLGGAYAQILAVDLVKNGESDFTAITFNAPGLDYSLKGTALEEPLKRVVNNYVIMNDFVGNFRVHVGNTYYIQPFPLDVLNEKGIAETPHGCILSYDRDSYGPHFSHPARFGTREAWALWIYDVNSYESKDKVMKAIRKLLDIEIKTQDLESAITILRDITENDESEKNIKLLNTFNYKTDVETYEVLSYEERKAKEREFGI